MARWKRKELEQAFLKDMELCNEWTLEENMTRPVLSRLRDSLSRLAAPLL